MSNHDDLSRRIEALFERQNEAGALLTDRLFRRAGAGEESGSARRLVTIEGFAFNLFYVRSRQLRRDENLLKELGVRGRGAGRYYEYDPAPALPWVRYINERAYLNLPEETRRLTKPAPFYNYFETNPRAESLETDLAGQDGRQRRFHITANYAPFRDNHFIVWPKIKGAAGLKQMYYDDLLYWIDDLFTHLSSPGWGLFFNPKNAGNSVDTLHFQLLKTSFPAFESLEGRYPESSLGIITTGRKDWPVPGLLARYTPLTKNKALPHLHGRIREWLSVDGKNTFNLLFRVSPRGFREFYIVFRKKGFVHLPGVNNEFAGYEAGGNIIIEDRGEYEDFPAVINRLELAERAE